MTNIMLEKSLVSKYIVLYVLYMLYTIYTLNTFSWCRFWFPQNICFANIFTLQGYQTDKLFYK